VRRYGTSYQQFGAVRFSNVGGTIRNVVMTDNAMVGLSLSNSNKLVDRVVSSNNGMLGIGGTQDDNSVIKNSIINGNNTQDFKDAPVSGGIKLTRTRGITVSNNEVKNNQSAGIWFDASCYNMKVVGNDAQNNRSTQIELEVSDTGIVANNTAFGGTTGILIFDTGNVKIYNNEVGGSSTFGIALHQDERRQADPTVPEAHDPRRPIPDPTVTWITRNITLANNAFGNGGFFQFYALDKATGLSADSMRITVNGNLFNKRVDKNPSQPTMVAWGQSDNHTLVRYETPQEFKAKNSTWNNAQTPGSYKITDMGTFKTQYASTALALPSDVAAAAGLPAGSKKIGRY
jgi:parallel beta-helix repeat protein